MQGRNEASVLKDLYAKQVVAENGFREYSKEEFEEAKQLSWQGADLASVEFWYHFEILQKRVGKARALDALTRIVNGRGLCMIMASKYGRQLIGPDTFDNLVRWQQRQTEFYRFATANNDFGIAPTFFKRDEISGVLPEARDSILR